MSRSSLALDNLRAYVILLVLSFHSVLAYLGSLQPTAFAFDDPPFSWRSFPIVDSARFWGFDLFCAWQDVFLMSLFFFLSGLFVWPSLKRKGPRTFLLDRLLRLALPYALVVGFLMPIAHYATYLQTAVDPGIAAYWEHLIALPVWPTGPCWFLFLLLMAAFCATALHKIYPGWAEALVRLVGSASDRPFRLCVALVVASAIGYVPLALAFTPLEWWHHGPIGFQLSRPLHYAVYFFAGAGIGAYGLDRGLFAQDGILVRRWKAWIAGALASFVLWLAVTSQTFDQPVVPLVLQVAAALSFVLACAANCFVVLALVLRFAAREMPALANLKDSSYGIYLIHYVFIIWLQFAMLDAPLPAIAKAAVVFVGTLVLSWGIIAAALRSLPRVAYVIGGERRVVAKVS